MKTALNLDYLNRCIATLEAAHKGLVALEADNIAYDIYRAACVKEFELVLEQSGKLLRKRLAEYFATNKQADKLPFKDLFRHAAKVGLIDIEACERWLKYRDNRNATAHDYGEKFAETTLLLLPTFITDAKQLATVIVNADG